MQVLEGTPRGKRKNERTQWPTSRRGCAASKHVVKTVSFMLQVLEGTPGGKEEEGKKLVADIQEGLRRLKGVIGQQDPGKVAFRCANQ